MKRSNACQTYKMVKKLSDIFLLINVKLLWKFSFTTSFKGNYKTDWQRMQNFFRGELVMSEIECIDRLVLLIRLNSFCWLLGTWYGSLLLTSQLSLRSFLYVLVSCLLRLCSTKSKKFH